MSRADYDGWMATVYDAGRSLAAESVKAWAAAAGPFLHGVGTGPVLDLGAGTGRFSGHLAAWSAGPVAAVEPAEAMAARAAAKQLAGVDVAVGRAEAVPLRDAAVRAAWLSQVVHHFEDLDRAARELARVVQPGGHVLLRAAFGADRPGARGSTTFAVYDWFPEAVPFVAAFPSRSRVLGAFRAAGFVVVEDRQVRQVTAASLRDLHDRVATRADSALASIDDATFAARLEALDRAAAVEDPPRPIVDHVDFVALRAG